MLAEVAGLGFVGLVFEVALFPARNVIGSISERYLGESEILLEDFEYLHNSFFQVGIAFFAMAGLMVVQSLRNIQRIRALQGIGLDDAGSCQAINQSLAGIMKARTLPPRKNSENNDDKSTTAGSSGGITWSDEEALALLPRCTLREDLGLNALQQGAEAVVIREYLVQQGRVQPNEVIDYETAFTKNLLELVELSPLSWLPLIPVLALANSVDISHDVINAESPNALETAGFFVTSLGAIGPSLVIAVLCLLWCGWNLYKISTVKSMLVPTIVYDTESCQNARILPPRYTIPGQTTSFLDVSTPLWMQPVERWLRKNAAGHDANQEPTSAATKGPHYEKDQVYGIIGRDAFADVYLPSIRFHTWLCTTQVFFYSSQILTRDVTALARGLSLEAGSPDTLVPEVVVYGILVALAVAQLALAPRTLYVYTVITKN